MGERNLTRRQYLLAALTSGAAALSGCGGDGGGDENGDSDTEDGGNGGGVSDDPGVWISRYGDPEKTRSTPSPAPTDLGSTNSYDISTSGGGSVAVTDTGVFALGTDVGRVDPSTGETAFSRESPVGRALFVQNGIVVCGKPQGGNQVAGLDAETGERAWLVEPGGTVVPFPTGDGIGYAGSHIGVLEPASGDTLWNRDRSLLSPTSVVDAYGFRRVATHPESDTVFAYTGSDETVGIEAYDLTNGEQRWERAVESSFTNPIPVAVQGDTVYVSRSSRSAGNLLALDRTTGDELWTADRSVVGRNVGVTVDGDGIYVANRSSAFALDPADGTEQWSTPVPSATRGLIATDDALVRIGDRIELLSKTDGELQGSSEIDETIPPTSGYAVADGRLYAPPAGFGGITVYGTE